MEPASPIVPSRASGRLSKGRSETSAALGLAGVISLSAVVFAAPLLVGSVHRPMVLAVPAIVGLSAGLLLLGELRRRSAVRVTLAAMLPLSVLLVPLVQSVPLPVSLAKWIDPAGDALLVDSPVENARFRPLSLDPPETRAIVGRAGGALAVFVAAFHLASGRSRKRMLLVRLVAASAVAAMAIGLGHRILGEPKIYGYFTQSRGLLNGPFINSNHLAEFLELGAFACVASALGGASALNRIGWLTAAAMAGACALGTLSRGAVLSLAAGTIVFVLLRHTAVSETDEAGGRSRQTIAWVTAALIALAALAVALGADQVVSRVRDTQLGGELRFRLWRDSLRVLVAHPFGIGRGAFERIYPVYRTLQGGMEVRFSFVENEPLQYLIEMGWVGFSIVSLGLSAVVVEWWRWRRRDQIEAALVGALVAVFVHNLVDFGLETLGIELPVAAILGTVLGRSRDVPERVIPWRIGAGVWGVAIGAIAIGGVAVAHASAADFDHLIANPPPHTTKREIALRAEAAHPVDYVYVLAQAATEPVRALDGQAKSPRLHALNHALLLCPNCPDVHAAVAGTLWALGRRPQALTEWQLAVEVCPIVFESLMQRAWSAGASPEELAVVAGSDAGRLLQTASFLISNGRPDGARVLLPMAAAQGAAAEDTLLLEARLDIAAGEDEDALKSLATARKLSPNHPVIFLLMSMAHMRLGKVEEALQDVDAGIGMNPHDLSLLRGRLDIVMSQRKWLRAKDALEALESELAEERLPTTEVHLASARYYSMLRDYGKASGEFNLALTQEPGNGAVWAELGTLWETAGRTALALDAYRHAEAVSPGNASVLAAIDRLTTQIRTIRAGAVLLP